MDAAVRFADCSPKAAKSDGTANQVLFVRFPPVVEGSQKVFVGEEEWKPVAGLAGEGPEAKVYRFTPVTGEIAFGDGAHGAIPCKDAIVSATYESGPHDGYEQF